jgi:hypothetical protein
MEMTVLDCQTKRGRCLLTVTASRTLPGYGYMV